MVSAGICASNGVFVFGFLLPAPLSCSAGVKRVKRHTHEILRPQPGIEFTVDGRLVQPQPIPLNVIPAKSEQFGGPQTKDEAHPENEAFAKG